MLIVAVVLFVAAGAALGVAFANQYQDAAIWAGNRMLAFWRQVRP